VDAARQASQGFGSSTPNAGSSGLYGFRLTVRALPLDNTTPPEAEAGDTATTEPSGVAACAIAPTLPVALLLHLKATGVKALSVLLHQQQGQVSAGGQTQIDRLSDTSLLQCLVREAVRMPISSSKMAAKAGRSNGHLASLAAATKPGGFSVRPSGGAEIVRETQHPLPSNNSLATTTHLLKVPGAEKLLLGFDSRSATASEKDYVEIMRPNPTAQGGWELVPKPLSAMGAGGKGYHSQGPWPGAGGSAPGLEIDGDCAKLVFTRTGGYHNSSTGLWGWRITAKAVAMQELRHMYIPPLLLLRHAQLLQQCLYECPALPAWEPQSHTTDSTLALSNTSGKVESPTQSTTQ
jgi:hypothetical protein